MPIYLASPDGTIWAFSVTNGGITYTQQGGSPTPVSGTTIGDLAFEVVSKFENRVAQLDRTYVWLRDALLEITGNATLRDEFDELEVWGEPYTLVPEQGEYSFDSLLPLALNGKPIPYNQATLDVLMWTNPPSNTVRIKLNPTHYQDADRATQQNSSQPSEWYRFGNLIGYSPTPNEAYQVRARILQMHPIATPLELTVVLLSQEWHNVLVWAAVEQGYMEFQEFEKAAAVHQLIHGDPKSPTTLGLIGAKHTRRKKEAWRQSIGLRPVIRSYSYGGR